MRRTQLYLEDDVWEGLHIAARKTGVTLSELVRRAVREKYLAGTGNSEQALRAAIGLWNERTDLPSASTYVRQLRKGDRLARSVR